jgi:hypothetical protein
MPTRTYASTDALGATCARPTRDGCTFRARRADDRAASRRDYARSRDVRQSSGTRWRLAAILCDSGQSPSCLCMRSWALRRRARAAVSSRQPLGWMPRTTTGNGISTGTSRPRRRRCSSRGPSAADADAGDSEPAVDDAASSDGRIEGRRPKAGWTTPQASRPSKPDLRTTSCGIRFRHRRLVVPPRCVLNCARTTARRLNPRRESLDTVWEGVQGRNAMRSLAAGFLPAYGSMRNGSVESEVTRTAPSSPSSRPPTRY